MSSTNGKIFFKRFLSILIKKDVCNILKAFFWVSSIFGNFQIKNITPVDVLNVGFNMNCTVY